jgi:hypothetical protein
VRPSLLSERIFDTRRRSFMPVEADRLTHNKMLDTPVICFGEIHNDLNHHRAQLALTKVRVPTLYRAPWGPCLTSPSCTCPVAGGAPARVSEAGGGHGDVLPPAPAHPGRLCLRLGHPGVAQGGHALGPHLVRPCPCRCAYQRAGSRVLTRGVVAGRGHKLWNYAKILQYAKRHQIQIVGLNVPLPVVQVGGGLATLATPRDPCPS